MHLMRTGDEAGGAPRARPRVQGVSRSTRSPSTCSRCSTSSTSSQVVQDGDIDLQVRIRDEARVLARVRDAARAGGAQDAVGAVRVHAEGADPHRDLSRCTTTSRCATSGCPGMIGALGACFGRVVTHGLAEGAGSPARSRWQATLWHELAHVITLQMSNQRVPRWLTEGISVYEEGREQPRVGTRDGGAVRAARWSAGKVLKLRDLNSGFTRARHDRARVLRGVAPRRAHRRDARPGGAARAGARPTARASRATPRSARALGVSIDELQGTFDKALDERFGAMRARAARRRQAGQARRGAPGRRHRRAEGGRGAKPGSYRAQLALGAGAAPSRATRRRSSRSRRPRRSCRSAIGAESPHAMMAALAEQLGDRPRAIKEYEALLAHGSHRRRGGAAAGGRSPSKAGDERAMLARGHDRVVALDPFDAAGAHRPRAGWR